MARTGLTQGSDAHAAMFWRAAVLDGGIAALVVVAPTLFDGPAYDTLRANLTILAALCLLAGGAALGAVTGLLPRSAHAAAAVAAILPVLLLSASFGLAGAVTGLISYGIEAAALSWTAYLLYRGLPPRGRVYVLMVGAILFAQGLSMLLAPGLYGAGTIYVELDPYLWIAAPAFLVGGAGLIASELRSAPSRRITAPLLAFALICAADLAALVALFSSNGTWTGVFSYGLMAAILLLAVPRTSLVLESPILFASLAAIAGAGDVIASSVAAAGGPRLASPFAVTRPVTALAICCTGAALALALHPGRPMRRLAAALGAVGLLAGLAETAVALAGGAESPQFLLGRVASDDLARSALAGPVAAAAIALLAIALIARQSARIVPALFVVGGSALAGLVALNVLGYMLRSPFLFDIYGPFGMRAHATVAFGALALAALAAGIGRLLAAPIGDRLFGTIASLAVLVLIRGSISDAALAHVFVDTADVGNPEYLAAVEAARQLTLVMLVAVAIGAGLLLTRTVTVPLRELLDAIRRARSGEARAQADVEGDDEIGIVARSFNQLTRELADQSDLYAAVRRAQGELGEAIVILENGEPRQWNEALATISGYGQAELLAMGSIVELWPLSQRDDIAALLRARSRDSYRLETAIRRRDGAPVDLELAVHPLRDGGRLEQLAILRDITESKQALRSLERLALHDALTGLPNRALFADRLGRTVAAAGRAGDSFAILYLDLDRFKEINDAFGHDAGDALLREFGERIGQQITSADTLARFGGDEFAILLPRSHDAVEAAGIAEVLRAVLRRPFDLRGHRVFVEASIGVVRFPDDGADAETLLRHADIAMYHAKRTGKGVIPYAAEHDPQSQRRLDLMSDLRHAIEREELCLYFQPQVSLDSGRPTSVEALVRWRHPTRGMVSPVDFIPLAEDSGFIDELALWVIRRATEAAASLDRQGQPVRIALNVSARNLHYAGLVDAVDAALRAARLDAAALTIEITETAVMSDTRRSIEALAGLAALGVRLSVDDFGTGYSSLAYLRRLPVNELKIDRAFVVDMLANPSSEAIVTTVIQLGHSLGLTVVAEGVEDAPTLEALTALHCDRAQGYHLARPMPVDELARWLASGGPPAYASAAD